MMTILSAMEALQHFIVMLQYVDNDLVNLIDAMSREIYSLQLRLHIESVTMLSPPTPGKIFNFY